MKMLSHEDSLPQSDAEAEETLADNTHDLYRNLRAAGRTILSAWQEALEYSVYLYKPVLLPTDALRRIMNRNHLNLAQEYPQPLDPAQPKRV